MSLVAAATVRVAVRDLGRSTGAGRGMLTTGAVALSAGVLAWSVLLVLATASQLPADLPSELAPRVLTSSYASAIVIAMLLAAVVLTAQPSTPSLLVMLGSLPVRRADLRLSQALPACAVALVVSLALSAPGILTTVRLGRGDPAAIAVAVGGIPVSALLGTTVGAAVWLWGSTLLARRLAPAVARGVSTALVVAASAAYFWWEVLRLDPAGPSWAPWPAPAVAAVATGDPWPSVAVVALWLAAPAALIVLAPGPRPLAGRPVALVVRVRRWPRNRVPALLTAHALVALRHPATLSTALLVPAGLVALAAVPDQPLLGPLVDSLRGALLVAPATLLVYADGPARDTAWLGLSAARTAWRRGAAAGWAVVAMVLSVLAALIGWVVDPSADGTPLPTAVRWVAVAALALAAGIIVPVGDSRPLDASLALAALAVALGVLTLGTGLAIPDPLAAAAVSGVVGCASLVLVAAGGPLRARPA